MKKIIISEEHKFQGKVPALSFLMEDKMMSYITYREKSILDLINKFGCIREGQIRDITMLSERVVNEALLMLERENMVRRYDNTDIYVALTITNINMNLIKCIDVLCFLSDKVRDYELEKFPFYIWMYLKNGNNIDITFIPEGEEEFYSSMINRSDASKIIAIVDNKRQIEKMDIEKPIKYCVNEQEQII